jgi:hypothetical protein
MDVVTRGQRFPYTNSNKHTLELMPAWFGKVLNNAMNSVIIC